MLRHGLFIGDVVSLYQKASVMRYFAIFLLVFGFLASCNDNESNEPEPPTPPPEWEHDYDYGLGGMVFHTDSAIVNSHHIDNPPPVQSWMEIYVRRESGGTEYVSFTGDLTPFCPTPTSCSGLYKIVDIKEPDGTVHIYGGRSIIDPAHVAEIIALFSKGATLEVTLRLHNSNNDNLGLSVVCDLYNTNFVEVYNQLYP